MIVGIVAEGETDQAVIEALVYGATSGAIDDVDVNYVQPPPTRGAHAGWELVLDWLRRERYREILPFSDLLVVHVDTDVCDRPGFDVSRNDGGRPLEPAELVARVADRLRGLIAPDFLAAHGHRIVLAIAVDEIECWLLPLLVDDDRAAKTTGCAKALQHALKLKNEPALRKDRRSYQAVARPLRKRKQLEAARQHSASLDAFVAALDAACAALASAPPTG